MTGANFRMLLHSTFFYIAIFCIALHFLHISYGFTTKFSIVSSLSYSFFHANIFHLIINMLALFRFRPRLLTCIVAYICAVVTSMIPIMAVSEPTVGLSAFLFAAYARKYYYHCMSFRQLILIQLSVAFIPHVNWRIHIAAFVLSWLFWALKDTYDTCKYYHIL